MSHNCYDIYILPEPVILWGFFNSLLDVFGEAGDRRFKISFDILAVGAGFPFAISVGGDVDPVIRWKNTVADSWVHIEVEYSQTDWNGQNGRLEIYSGELGAFEIHIDNVVIEEIFE